jgi:hypothetical protein
MIVGRRRLTDRILQHRRQARPDGTNDPGPQPFGRWASSISSSWHLPHRNGAQRPLPIHPHIKQSRATRGMSVRSVDVPHAMRSHGAPW